MSMVQPAVQRAAAKVQAIQNLMVVTLTIRTAIKMAQRQVHRMHVHNLQTVYHIHAVHVHRERARIRTITVQRTQHAHQKIATNLWPRSHVIPGIIHLGWRVRHVQTDQTTANTPALRHLMHVHGNATTDMARPVRTNVHKCVLLGSST